MAIPEAPRATGEKKQSIAAKSSFQIFKQDLVTANNLDSKGIKEEEEEPYRITSCQVEIRRAPLGLICTNCFAQRWELGWGVTGRHKSLRGNIA